MRLEEKLAVGALVYASLVVLVLWLNYRRVRNRE